MAIDLVLLIGGLAILIGGGELLVSAASSLARTIGVSPLVIGLTVVAFGTSAPELAVNVGAALRGSGELAFGNVFGSNMANIGLVVGIIAMLDPIPIHSILIRRELPMMLLAMAAACILALDTQLSGGLVNTFQRGDGLVLLLFFFIFLYYTVGDLMRPRESSAREYSKGTDALLAVALPIEHTAEDEGPGVAVGEPTEPANETPPHLEDSSHGETEVRLGRDLLLTAAGLAGLVGGASLAVSGALGVARYAGVSEVVIGLTLMSVGTSLPELVAGLVALRHDKTDMAVGSVIGSNIFNTLLVMGSTATIAPVSIPAMGYFDLAATAILSLVLTLTAYNHNRLIIRYEGVVLLLMYLSYMIWRSGIFA